MATGPRSKLDIVRDYAKAYSTILAAQTKPSLHHAYIDAFAGAGVHQSKTRGDEILGSPQIAVATDPPFREYHFIDFDSAKVENLRSLSQERSNVHVYEGDCNRIMLEQVLPQVRYESFRRGCACWTPTACN